MRTSERDHQPEESMNIGELVQPVPIDPRGVVVLVVRVVVAVLGREELIAHAKHGNAVRQHEDRREVLRLSPAKRDHLVGYSGVALPAAVPGEVVVGSVRVVVTVRLVVFAVVRDEVVEREPIVGSDEVHTLIRTVRIQERVREEVVAPVQPPHERRNLALIAADKTPDVITKRPVPLRPVGAGEGTAELVAAEVPGLGDEPDVAQRRVGPDSRDERRITKVDRPVGPPGEDRRQVEAESVHVHLVHPVPQAVENERSHEPVVGPDDVAGPGIVAVEAAILFEQVVRGVVDASL